MSYGREEHEPLGSYRARVERVWRQFVGAVHETRTRGRRVATKLAALNNMADTLDTLAEIGLVPERPLRWVRNDKPERVAGAWHGEEYVPSRPVTQGQFIAEVERVMRDEQIHQVVLEFHRVDGGIIRRTVTRDPERGSPTEQIERWLEGGATHGSDQIQESDELDLGVMMRAWVDRRRDGAAARSRYTVSRTHLYVMRDYECAEGDCAFAAIRQITPKKIAKRNKTIRRELALPEGALGFEHLDALAEYFGVAIEVYIEAVCATEEYDDAEMNRFVGSHTHKRIYRAGEEDAPVCNLYYENRHYSLISAFNPIPPSAFCPVTGDYGAHYTQAELKARLREQGRVYQKAAAKTKVEKYRERVLVFDFETVWDVSRHNELRPYAVAWYDFDPTSCEISGALEPEVHYSCALDSCAADLLDYIEKAPQDVRYTIVGFNSARFDHFLLAAAAQNRGMLHGVFATGSQIRSMSIGRHMTLDLIKLLSPAPLKVHCVNFKTNPVKVDGFSHTLPQNAFNEGRLQDWLAANAAEVEHYTKYDVLSTASLFTKACNALEALIGQNARAGGVQTIGGAAWKAYEMTAKKEGRVKYPAESEELDRFFRRAIVGGRVQNFKPSGHVERGALRMVDVASLYPTVMYGQNKHLMPEETQYGVYPTGKPRRTEVYMPGKIGFYNVTVVRQPPRNVLPQRRDDGRLDWRSRESFDTVTTQCSIELIRRNGGEVIVHDGYYFPGKDDKAFTSFLEPIFAAKDEEDALKEAGAQNANPSRREMAKLLMNSLSGKCAQRNFDQRVVLATGSVRQLEAEASMRDGMATWLPLCGETCILVGKKPLDRVYSKRSKPSYMAALIYEYSRGYMYQLLISRYDVQYMDTDSALLCKDEYDRFRADYPELDFKTEGRSKRLGDLEEEMNHASDITAMLLGPKEYCLYDHVLEKPHKAKIKGVCLSRDKSLDEPQLNLYRRATEYGKYEMYETLACAKPIEVFRSLVEGRTVHMLCSQIHRALCSPESGSVFALIQRFMVKEIRPRAAYDTAVPAMSAPLYRREAPANLGPAVGNTYAYDLDDVFGYA